MPPAKFEPTIPASEGSQTHALDRAATGIYAEHTGTQQTPIHRALCIEQACCRCYETEEWHDGVLYCPLQYRVTSAPLMPEAICMQHNTTAVLSQFP
jgi:hypothetical protein